MDGVELRRLKSLESENLRLKRMYSELALDHQLAKEIIGKRSEAMPKEEDGSPILSSVRHQQGVPRIAPCAQHGVRFDQSRRLGD
jgi:hypothetical protein